MSRPLSTYADEAAAFVTAVSADNVRVLSARHVIPVAERRENLLALAQAVRVESTWGPFRQRHITENVRTLVSYYAVTVDPMPAFGRLLKAVAECDEAATSKALSRLVGDE